MILWRHDLIGSGMQNWGVQKVQDLPTSDGSAVPALSLFCPRPFPDIK